MMYLVPNNMLYHHGILGQKWGIRRFQPYGQGYAGSKGKFVGKTIKVSRDEMKAVEEHRKKNSPERVGRKRLNEEEKKVVTDHREQKDIQESIQKGDIKKIKKYLSKMSTNQLKEAATRLSLKAQIQKISRGRVSEGWNEINHIMDRFGDINSWVNTSTRSADTVNSIIKFIDEMSK